MGRVLVDSCDHSPGGAFIISVTATMFAIVANSGRKNVPLWKLEAMKERIWSMVEGTGRICADMIKPVAAQVVFLTRGGVEYNMMAP